MVQRALRSGGKYSVSFCRGSILRGRKIVSICSWRLGSFTHFRVATATPPTLSAPTYQHHSLLFCPHSLLKASGAHPTVYRLKASLSLSLSLSVCGWPLPSPLWALVSTQENLTHTHTHIYKDRYSVVGPRPCSPSKGHCLFGYMWLLTIRFCLVYWSHT